jgi:hypothetical protein
MDVQILRTLAGRMDGFVSDNERIVETGLAVSSKGRDSVLNLNRLGGADESDGRSKKEGKHKKTKRPHDVNRIELMGKVRRSEEDLRSEKKMKPEKISFSCDVFGFLGVPESRFEIILFPSILIPVI